jgi:hypothetical protein
MEAVIKYLTQYLEIELSESEDMYSKDLTIKLSLGGNVISESSIQIENKL